MTLKEKIENENLGSVTIEDYRTEVKNIIKNYFGEMDDSQLFYLESLVFRGIALEGINNVSEQDIRFILSVANITDKIRKNMAKYEKKNIQESLWNSLYNYIDEELFDIDDDMYYELKHHTSYLSKILDSDDFFKTGVVPEEVYKNISVYELKLAIQEFLEFVFENELEK